MSLAITDDHRALAKTAADFLTQHEARGAARLLLESGSEPMPPFWDDLRKLGWLGLHLPDEYGGSGFGLPELVVVVEELGVPWPQDRLSPRSSPVRSSRPALHRR